MVTEDTAAEPTKNPIISGTEIGGIDGELDSNAT